MKSAIDQQLAKVLHHLYVNPLEKCNLKCKICYTRKTDPILSEESILEFVNRYQKAYELQTVTFCGGEVFSLKYFPRLVNTLTQRGIFVQTITNGTIDRLSEIENPNMNKIIVSIDGLKSYHDKNRGLENFDKSMRFLKKAQKKDFHTEIFSIVTRQNYPQINKFEKYINQHLGQIEITYHPRKPLTYLLHNPISNVQGTVEDFDFLNNNELTEIMKTKRVFPPKELGCYQVSLASTGKIYGCCEGFRPIGMIDDKIEDIFNSLKKRIGGPCLGCSQTEFMCGIKKLL
ncbi:MAG: radical SAM protein [Patescibacteria group bacterium]|jgi:MoaA/NifB/PqqE/SkfB family radical SAM enzyme